MIRCSLYHGVCTSNHDECTTIYPAWAEIFIRRGALTLAHSLCTVSEGQQVMSRRSFSARILRIEYAASCGSKIAAPSLISTETSQRASNYDKVLSRLHSGFQPETFIRADEPVSCSIWPDNPVVTVFQGSRLKSRMGSFLNLSCCNED